MGTLAGTSGSEDFCRILFEATEDGCFFGRLLDEREEPFDWAILAANAAFERLSGLQNLAGRRLSEVLPFSRSSAPDLLAAFRRVADGGPAESLEPMAGPLATWGPTEVLSPGPGLVIVRFRAIRAGQPGEGALHQRESCIHSGLENLLSGVAHNLNNVLGAILAVATAHQRKAEAGSPLRRDMETIAQACLRGGALAKSLLGTLSASSHQPGDVPRPQGEDARP